MKKTYSTPQTKTTHIDSEMMLAGSQNFSSRSAETYSGDSYENSAKRAMTSTWTEDE